MGRGREGRRRNWGEGREGGTLVEVEVETKPKPTNRTKSQACRQLSVTLALWVGKQMGPVEPR